MSRYSLKPLPEHSGIFEVAVGWDPGLGTFFAIVFGVPSADRDPDVRHWLARIIHPVEFGALSFKHLASSEHT